MPSNTNGPLRSRQKITAPARSTLAQPAPVSRRPRRQSARLDQAQLDAQQSEAKFRAIFESSPVPLVLEDGRGNIVLINDAFTRTFGYTLADIPDLANWWPKAYPDPAYRQWVIDLWAASLSVTRGEGFQTEPLEFDICCRNGATRTVLGWVNLLRQTGHEMHLVTFLDVTRRKKAEQSLRESEERFRTVLNNAVDVVYRVNLATDHFDYISPSALKVLGLSRSALAAMPVSQAQRLIHPDDLSAVRAALKQLDRRGEAKVVYRQRAADGTYRWLSNHLSLVRDQAGRPLYRYGNVRDITEAKQTEEALRGLSHRLRQAKDDEQRRIARELHDATSQALAATTMNLDMLQDLLPAGNSRARKLLHNALALVAQCAQEVRTVSYLLHPPLLDQMGLVPALRAYLQGFSQRSGVAVQIVAPDDLGRYPLDIELALFRVAQECLGNIYRHSGSHRACLSLEATATSLLLEITDHGRGLPRTLLLALKQAKPVGGVGFASMRERLSDLGGALEINSSRRGTIVRATVPLPLAPHR